MKGQYRKILDKNRAWLEENLEPDPLIHHCIEKNILTVVDSERVTSSGARPDKVLKFLDILKCKPDSAYEQFILLLGEPQINQPAAKERLEATEVPDDTDGNLELPIEQTLGKYFFADTSAKKVLSKEEFLLMFKAGLRIQHRKWLPNEEFETVFAILRRVHPEIILKRNLRRRITAVCNIGIKQELYETVVNETGAEPASLDVVSSDEVALVVRPHLEKLKLDPDLSETFATQDIDGQLLSELSSDTISRLFPQLSIGNQMKVKKAVDLTLDDLKKRLEAALKQTEVNKECKFETYREFDTLPNPRNVYENGHIFPDEQHRPQSLLKPIHRYSMAESAKNVAEEAIRFAAACMNDRANGTIHFGVVSRFDSSSKFQAGKLIGIPVDKLEFELAVTDEIYRAFHGDQRKLALMCIRSPVYIPVTGCEGTSEQLYVVEVDVVPNTSVVATEAFFLRPSQGRHSHLLRYTDGTATALSPEEQIKFMNSTRKILTGYRKEERLRLRSVRRPNLHRKLHGLLTEGNKYTLCDIFPLLFLSPCAEGMTRKYLAENFSFIKSLEPSAVFDFDTSVKDATGQPCGLYPILESEYGQVYKVFTTDNFDINSEENRSSGSKDAVVKLCEDISESSLKTWIFCNGYEPLEKEKMPVTTWISSRGQGFREAVRFYEKEIPHDNACIFIFILSKNYDVLLGTLVEIFAKFPDQWILVAESETIAQDLMAEVVRRDYVEKEVLQERSIIGMPWSHFNQSIQRICGHSTVSGCNLSTSSGGSVFLKEKKKSEWSDLEILSMTQCEEEELDQDERDKKSFQTEEEFFHGQEVKWWNFYFKTHVLEREQTKELRNFVSELLEGNNVEDENVGVVNLLFQPGAGATTIARHVLWDMKEKARCCIIKQITEKTCDQIAHFRAYEEQDLATPPIVLVENITDFERICFLRSQLNQRAKQEARLCRGGTRKLYCILIICRRLSASARSGRYQDKLKVTVDHELQPPELDWFRRKVIEMDKRYRRLQGKNPKLLISFNLLKENCNPEYIKRTVHEFIGEILSFKERRLLKYITLVNNFDFAAQAIPLSCFNPIMNPPGRGCRPQLNQEKLSKGDACWGASLSSSLNVLLNRTSKRLLGKGVDAVRIINGNLSQEILDNLCCREDSKLSDVVLEFLHSELFKKSNRSCVQGHLVKIMKSVLKTRVVGDKGREDFAPIILAIAKNEGYDQAADVLKAGYDIFEDPMIGQQVARVYLRLQNWKEAERYAKDALDMDPGNSFLCDTFGQVFKGKLLEMWITCVQNFHNIDSQAAKAMLETGFKAIEIFQEEQKLCDKEVNFDYISYGFTSELRVIATLLDVCLFLEPFHLDKALLRHFLIDEKCIPDGLQEIIGEDNIKQLKKLYLTYETPLRRVEDEGIQLKEDPSYQDSPSYHSYKESLHTASRIKVRLLSYFGEDTDTVPKHLNAEEVCEYRRRRVKKTGGMSLYSTQELKKQDGALETFRRQYQMILANVKSNFCNAEDLKTVIDLTLAQLSLNRRCSEHFSMPDILVWTQKLLYLSNLQSRPYLESFLYMVMFHWPTDWRKEQTFSLCSCRQIKEVIIKWKEAFFNNHPSQGKDRKRPDRRKATTMFFLGQGTGFDEIAHYSEIKHLERNGESIWNYKEVHNRLKHLTGILCHEGKKVSLGISSAQGESVKIDLPTSFPITDDLMWQKPVHFFLGFCWSGPRAFGVRPDPFDLTPEPTLAATRGLTTFSRTHFLVHVVTEDEQFWKQFEEARKKLDELEKQISVCSQMGMLKTLQQQKEKAEKQLQKLMEKRQTVLQGSD